MSKKTTTTAAAAVLKALTAPVQGPKGTTKYGHPWALIPDITATQANALMVGANLKDASGRFVPVSDVMTVDGQPVSLSLSVEASFPNDEEGAIALGRFYAQQQRSQAAYRAEKAAEKAERE